VLYLVFWGVVLYSLQVGVEVVWVPLAGGAVVGMGSGSYSYIWGSVPVAAVVAGVESGLAEVGDLVVLKAGFAEMVAHGVIHGGAGVVIGRDDAVLLAHTVQWGAFLIGEAVGGDVLDIQAGGCFEVMVLGIRGLAGKAVHQVYADVVYSGILAGLDGIYGLAGGVTAAQETEEVIIEGLDSHADAVDAQGTEGTNVIWRDVIGIAFYGQFLQIIKAVLCADALYYLPYLSGSEA